LVDKKFKQRWSTIPQISTKSQQPPQTREQLKKNHMELEIQVVLWDSHKYAAGLNQLYVFFSLLFNIK
jgi:hypothetical protein